MPKRWTSEATPDPFDSFARGRAHFRMDDLVKLVALLDALGAGGGTDRVTVDV